jgi:predicted PurR-regulated permease PerM
VVSILLAIGVALLFFMVTKADNIADTSSQLINQSFEEETIERVRSLSDNISNIQDTHPQDRTNPFY